MIVIWLILFWLGFYSIIAILIDPKTILQNTFSNIVSELTAGIFVAFFVSRFIQKLSEIQGSIGALVIIEAEIQVNKHILETLLHDGIEGFEKAYNRRGNFPSIPQSIFDDAANEFSKQINQLLFDAFHQSYSGLGTLTNRDLLEKIINIYTVSYHFRLKSGFSINVLDWTLLDQIKIALNREISSTQDVLEAINREIAKQRKRNALFESLIIP